MVKISKRLQLVASFVPDNANIIDVGCDHALLSIYLSETLKHVKITASDINANPLKKAQENLEKYHLENKIKLVLKDGLEDLETDIDTIVIAGMGGILISNILTSKKDYQNIKSIILSPNNEFEQVRKAIKKIGFKIVKEKLVIDKEKTYLVLKAIKGKEKLDYFFGTLKNNELETVYYYTNMLSTNTKILKSMPKKYILKRLKLSCKNKKIKKFLVSKTVEK